MYPLHVYVIYKPEPEFVEKSDWQPPKQGRDLETFISSVESDIAKHKPPTPKHDNLKPSERSALHSLQKREDIIIKPAENDVNPPINNDPMEKRNEFIDHPSYLVISPLVFRAGCGIWLCQFLIIAYLLLSYRHVPTYLPHTYFLQNDKNELMATKC